MHNRNSASNQNIQYNKTKQINNKKPSSNDFLSSSSLFSSLFSNYLEKENLYEYFFDMIFTQKMAQLNRQLIIFSILNILNEYKMISSLTLEYNSKFLIESMHNYIDFKDWIVRKGAIACYPNESCIIALNMRWIDYWIGQC